MVHDPVEQGDNKYNSFLSSMFILRADASGAEMLILLLYFYIAIMFILRAEGSFAAGPSEARADLMER